VVSEFHQLVQKLRLGVMVLFVERNEKLIPLRHQSESDRGKVWSLILLWAPLRRRLLWIVFQEKPM